MKFYVFLLAILLACPVSETQAQEKLVVDGAITVSNSASETPAPGTIRFFNNDFYGWNGSTWVSFTTSESFTGATVRSYLGTQSPGDLWDFTIDITTSTWSATWDHGTEGIPGDDITIGGNYSVLTSGFLKLVISTSMPSDPMFPTDGSAFFYASEIPGLSLFAQPAGVLTGSLINSVYQSGCGSIFGNYNFAQIAPPTSYDPQTERAYGTIQISGTPAAITFSGIENSLDCLSPMGACTINSQPFAIAGSGVCDTSGTIEIKDGPTLVATAQLTPSNTFMMDFGAGNGGIYGGRQSAAVSLSDIIGIPLRGFFDVPETDEQRATSIVFDAAGDGIGTLYLDLETNTLDTDNLVPVHINSVSNGLLEGFFVNMSGDTSYMAGSVVKNGSDVVLTLVSYQDNDTPPTNPALTVAAGYSP